MAARAMYTNVKQAREHFFRNGSSSISTSSSTFCSQHLDHVRSCGHLQVLEKQVMVQGCRFCILGSWNILCWRWNFRERLRELLCDFACLVEQWSVDLTGLSGGLVCECLSISISVDSMILLKPLVDLLWLGGEWSVGLTGLSGGLSCEFLSMLTSVDPMLSTGVQNKGQLLPCLTAVMIYILCCSCFTKENTIPPWQLDL